MKFKILMAVLCAFFLFSCSDRKNPASVTDPAGESGTLNTVAPSSTVKLIFIHHSTGENWLQASYGGLGTALNANNYFVSDTNYNWNDPGYDQGSYTDTEDWPDWFRNEVMPYVYAEYGNTCYTNTITEPTGENEIIMFKSCFPNSEVEGSIDDEKVIYNNILTYTALHTDKLFILIIPPPEQVLGDPLLTREISNWLADRQNGWLKNYTHGNVYAYDYYNVLTHPDNHHMVINGAESHTVANSQNTLYYPSTDDHPSAAGQQKAVSEFVPLLNGWYNEWKNN
ncbi:MAG: hypothetical protein BWY84_00559 [Candidatus Aerophobetes bacterium ADurb.Bin490]|nr:MAG: hypothetical protein BWY84_00559 [Candidatus Aerophobetes bacterium ADurb.Bin490]HPI02591.1 hypothetical protein [Candidatus Goldiibacteriota bacterium]HPN64386.1 hypothetical protein [Candidatus Goldiibacteriota bacterium]HRQ42779.1 hypothetical protein [Candidatus Goldiibacteriota bacterium]